MGAPRILVIEDEPDIVEVLTYNLTREGYHVLSAKDGEEGLRKARQEGPSLVLLDLMLPGIDGVEICRRLKADRATRATPIIMVTAKGDESDVVLGLGLGADDYVKKPFSPKEVVARVRAVLRRAVERGADLKGERLAVRGLLIDQRRHEMRVDGKKIDLTPTEFRLLRALAARPGEVFERQELLGHAVGPDTIVVDRSVDVHVNSIRKKLGKHRDLIQTVRGVGYRFADRKG
ncbi:MAG: response regulator [Candidatus Eisenbacteria bacterium]|nr:response regulator [Candidatus Eisenbacteria bacterium]